MNARSLAKVRGCVIRLASLSVDDRISIEGFYSALIGTFRLTIIALYTLLPVVASVLLDLATMLTLEAVMRTIPYRVEPGP